jgi:ABC-type multidrug transport system ATPase subunit
VLVVLDLSRISVPDRLIEPFFALLQELRNAGKTVVIVNTSRAFVQRACTHASFLMDGTIRASDSVQALCDAFDKHILCIGSSEPKKAMSALSGAFPQLRITQDGDILKVYGEGDAAKKCTISAAATVLEGAGVSAREIRVPAPSLEEAFLEVRRTL